MEEARLTGRELGAAKEEISWKRAAIQMRSNHTGKRFMKMSFCHLCYAEYDLR